MKHRCKRDFIVVLVIIVFSYGFFGLFDVLEKIVAFSARHENFEIDELVSTCIVLAICLAIYSIRRTREVMKLYRHYRKKSDELQRALKEIKQLRGILPFCSFCKKIRNDAGYWEQVDIYIHEHTDADISHGICPDCMREHYPEVYWKG